MKFYKINKFEIKQYLKKHSPLYISFLVCFLVGVLFGVITAVSSDAYLKLLTKDNKLLFSFITGRVGNGSVFAKMSINLMTPFLLIFLLNLNFYLGLFSYLLVAYQSSILTQTIFALISTYGVSGVLNVLFIILPINILYFFVMIFFSSVCLSRSKQALKNKKWRYGLKEEKFFVSAIATLLMIILICFIGVIIVPLFLKSAIFIIF